MIAEMKPARARLMVFEKLQWGRDQMIAEIWEEVYYPDREDLASMGPRSNDRGNVAVYPPGEKQLHASMGPRSNDRGNLAHTLLTRPGKSALQWGRDQMIAEIGLFATRQDWAGMLQWGRDQMIAEIRRKTGFKPLCHEASMGPRSNDRGNLTRKGSNDGRYYCFNGAAIE